MCFPCKIVSPTITSINGGPNILEVASGYRLRYSLLTWEAIWKLFGLRATTSATRIRGFVRPVPLNSVHLRHLEAHWKDYYPQSCNTMFLTFKVYSVIENVQKNIVHLDINFYSPYFSVCSLYSLTHAKNKKFTIMCEYEFIWRCNGIKYTNSQYVIEYWC